MLNPHHFYFPFRYATTDQLTFVSPFPHSGVVTDESMTTPRTGVVTNHYVLSPLLHHFQQEKSLDDFGWSKFLGLDPIVWVILVDTRTCHTWLASVIGSVVVDWFYISPLLLKTKQVILSGNPYFDMLKIVSHLYITYLFPHVTKYTIY